MFPRAIVVIAALFALASVACAGEPTVEPLPITGVHHLSPDPLGLGDPAGIASSRWLVRGWLTGDDTYCVLSEPDGRRPDGVTIYLYWDEDSISPITLTADLRRIDASDPGRPVPGSAIVTSEPVDVGPFSSPGLKAVRIPLPHGVGVGGEPFFTAVRVVGSGEASPALVTDDAAVPARTSLTSCEGRWSDLSDHGVPGALCIHVTSQERVPTPPLLSTWTSIKSRYRPARASKLMDCGERDPVEG